MAPRGARGGPRRGAPLIRSRGTRRRGSARGAGVQKTQATRIRPLQPRIAAALQSTFDHGHESDPTPTTTEQYPAPPTGPKVTRTPDTKFMCSPSPLLFFSICGLKTTPDTDTITLNLMDFFLALPVREYLAELWNGNLHATCFLLASELTGGENEVEDVCQAVGMQTAGLAAMGANEESLKVLPSQVLEGLRMTVGWEEEIRGCVGRYWDVLEDLVGRPAGGGAGVEGAEVQAHVEAGDGLVEAETSRYGECLDDLDIFDEV